VISIFEDAITYLLSRSGGYGFRNEQQDDRIHQSEESKSNMEGDTTPPNGVSPYHHQNDLNRNDGTTSRAHSQLNGASVTFQNGIEQSDDNDNSDASEQWEENGQQSTRSDEQSAENNDDDDDSDSDSTERPTTENQAVLVNDGYFLPPRVIPAIGYLVWQFEHAGVPLASPHEALLRIKHLAIAATQDRANQFLDDWITHHPDWQVLDNSPDLHGNTQCTLVRGRAHGGSIMVQMKVAEINIVL
ncbi:MAG: hypothetical protein LQ349_007106, partial [Xanthoria aureola]